MKSKLVQGVVRRMREGYIGADANGNSADISLQALRIVGGLEGQDFSA